MGKNKTQEKPAKIRTKPVHASPVKVNRKSRISMNSILTVVCIAIAAWFGYKGYLETRVNTPYSVEKVYII